MIFRAIIAAPSIRELSPNFSNFPFRERERKKKVGAPILSETKQKGIGRAIRRQSFGIFSK